MKRIDAKAGTITFDDEDGEEITQPVTGGRAKMQWKPDFGMRWAALGVDFEMFGKDHQPNQPVYAHICKALGVEPPVNFVYELFLDQNGEKISKIEGQRHHASSNGSPTPRRRASRSTISRSRGRPRSSISTSSRRRSTSI